MTIQLIAVLPDARKVQTRILSLVANGMQWSMFEVLTGGGKKLLGCHAFLELANANAGALTLFVSNAACTPDGHNHPGLTFFKSIELVLGDGWQCEREYGPATTMLVPPPAVGHHKMPSGRGLVFRFAVWRGNNQRAAMLMLERTSTILPQDADAWGPALTKLPVISYDYEPSESTTLTRLHKCLSTGTADVSVDMRRAKVGPWHLPGHELPYEYGGFEINTVWGWRRAPSSFQRHRLISDRWAERTFWCFDMASGEPMDSESFAKGAGKTYQPFEMVVDGDPNATNTEGRHICLPPAFDVMPYNSGNCVYSAAFDAVMGVDIAHDVRCQGHAWAAWQLGKDPFTGFFIRAHSNWIRMAWTEKGRPKYPWETGGNDYRYSLSSLIERATANPAVGSADRRFAWVMANACAMLWVAPSEAERTKAKSWLKACMTYHSLVALPPGIVGNFGPGGIAGAWDPVESDGAGIPANKNATQCFHEALVIYWAIAAMHVQGQLKPGVLAPLRQAINANARIVKKAGDSMWFNPKLTWNGAPPHYVATAVNGTVLAETTNPGYGAPSAPYDPAHVEPCLARMRVVFGDEKYRTKLCTVGPVMTVAQRIAHCEKIVRGQVAYADPAWVVEELAVLKG